MRTSEAANLQIENLDLDSGALRVERGKGGKDRVAFLGSKAIQALRDYLGARASGPVFLNGRGNAAVTAEGIQQAVKNAAKRVGLQGVHPHTIRHSFATHLLNRGADLRYVQEFLGHALVSTTAFYTHLAVADLARIYEHHPHAAGDEHE